MTETQPAYLTGTVTPFPAWHTPAPPPEPIARALAAVWAPLIASHIEPLAREVEALRGAVALLSGSGLRPTLTVAEAAEATGIGATTIRGILNRNPDLRIRVGTVLLIRWPAFTAWLGEQRAITPATRGT